MDIVLFDGFHVNMNYSIKKIFFILHITLILSSLTCAENYKKCCVINVNETVTCDSSDPCTSLPTKLKPTVITLRLKDQPFLKSTLTKHNFSHYAPPHISLRELFIRNCNVKLLTSNSFSALTKLETIDLSENKNMKIEKDVFKGLKLRSLSINNAMNLKLDNNSFRDLEVTTLSMTHCGLSYLTYIHLAPLSNSLRTLVLANNRIKTLDSRMGIIFRQLSHLDLTGNPLKCDCKIKWLIDVYKLRLLKSPANRNRWNSPEFSRLEPVCVTPNHVRNVNFTKIKNEQVICDSPQITNLDIHFENITNPRLVCTGYQDAYKAPLQISWVFSNGNSITESFINNHYPNKTLTIKPHTNYSYYRCIINNTVGSTVASVNINWPSFLAPNGNPQIPNTNQPDHSINTSWHRVFLDRRFTLLEILLAIFGTILLTAVLFVVLHRYLFKHCIEFDSQTEKHKKFNKYSSNLANVSLTTNCNMNAQQIYSNSQTYDQPGLPYSTSSQSYLPTSATEVVLPSCSSSMTLNASSTTCNSNNCHHNPQQQFLDFKTQRKIYRKP